MKVKSSRQECPLHTGLRLGLHVGAEDGIDAGLVTGVLAEPAEQVGVEAHGHDFFWRRHDDFGGLPEFCVCGVGIGVVNGREITLIYADRKSNQRRIISAWRSEPHERRRYWQSLEEQ